MVFAWERWRQTRRERDRDSPREDALLRDHAYSGLGGLVLVLVGSVAIANVHDWDSLRLFDDVEKILIQKHYFTMYGHHPCTC